MNLFDELPEIGECPHCGHCGDGLQFAIPDDAWTAREFERVQAACLSCGVHGPIKESYQGAASAFLTGAVEEAS